jgi:ribosomal peptide maturation radical SAM protein 1
VGWTSDVAGSRHLGRTEPARVLLLSMPYGALERPSLGLGLLQAGLRQRGIVCRTHYLGFTFADFVGVDEYVFVYSQLPYTAFAGDWTFTGALYDADSDDGYVDEVLQGTWNLDDNAVARILRVRAYAEPFLDHCLTSIDWSTFDVVGFTSTFEQNIASLALARRLKAAYPGIVTVFGGANWEGEMGEELLRQFPFVDVVCSGEADGSFPAVVETLSAGGCLDDVAGIVHRVGSPPRATPCQPMVTALDDLPTPDFDEFFASSEASRSSGHITHRLLMETARGCWWGALSHCTFCGLNGGTMAFRSKSPDRVLDELHHLVDRYGVRQISFVDNILDMRYFRSVLPRIADELPDLHLFYEVKANLSHGQIRELSEAGVHDIQPGIESMSDHVLELMRKGTTALRNVQLLKWCREFGINAEWNLIYGFPGETAEDYLNMLPLLESIRFLGPPTACGPIRLDRFSPFHEQPASFGMVNVRPMRPYSYLYPFADADSLLRIAYYFDFDYVDGRRPEEYAWPVLEYCQAWTVQPENGALWQLGDELEDGLVLVDERGGQTRRIELAGWKALVYRACDRAQPISDLMRLSEVAAVGVRQLAAFVNHCVEERLMLVRGRTCLSLAVQTPARMTVEKPATTRRLTLTGSTRRRIRA